MRRTAGNESPLIINFTDECLTLPAFSGQCCWRPFVWALYLFFCG